MMSGMKLKYRVLILIFSIALVLVTPAMLLADEPEDKIYDARLEGYGTNVTLENSSTALMWLLLIVLGAICVGVMFKSAKRTHLD